MSSIALTVLFATRNGEDVLPRTLEGYCRVERPSHAWKIVVVDNGSEDLTPAILATFKERLPLETLRQPIAGKNRALNYGLSALEGDLVIITDDDAIPDSSFLKAWSRYLSNASDYEIFGGSIDPIFEVPPPKWIFKNKDQFDMLFAVRDLPEGPIAPDEIFGPNMAVRISIFASGFRFNENFGPNESDPHYPMGSETEFCCRVAQSGAKAWFAKEPRVRHMIRRNQLARAYWAKRAYRHGRGAARRTWEFGQAVPPNISRPFIIDQLACLRHRLQMFSPFPLQRLNSVRAYYWRRGFRDEWAERQVMSRPFEPPPRPVI
jgi:glycosyltransferase involved in cell wall biosynthesis